MKKISFHQCSDTVYLFPDFRGRLSDQHQSKRRFPSNDSPRSSIDIDGVYSNPAGLSFLSHEGFYLSLTGQSAYQTREIDATFPLFQQADGTNGSRLYKGTASAPFIPSFQGLYKKG